jgi:hypothetical protein
VLHHKGVDKSRKPPEMGVHGNGIWMVVDGRVVASASQAQAEEVVNGCARASDVLTQLEYGDEISCTSGTRRFR